MDLVDKLRAISGRIPHQAEHLKTEEATKMALIVPFLAALGWDVYNPFEVVPEFTADVGLKKGEKVDYAIMRDDTPIILVEAKMVGVNLDKEPASQLYRYFSVTKARVGILTDGVIYRFFSDIEEPNKMDSRPFLEFDLRDFDDAAVAELKRFTKTGFNIDEMLSAAVELKYTRALKSFLREQMHTPTGETVRFFASQVYGGRMTQSVRDQFVGITKRALVGIVNDAVAQRLKHALGDDAVDRDDDKGAEDEGPMLPEGVVAIDGDVITTQEEVDAFLIVKAIVGGTISASRVHMRDSKSYCSVIVDNNNRKPLCRLRFNSKKKKYLSLFDAEKNESKVEIEDLDGIYAHANLLRETASRYVE